MTFENRLRRFMEHANEIIPGIRRGIEKESLRITPDGRLAQTPHPIALGSALTHPSITTDYSEALLELVTPTFASTQEVLNHLEKLHQFVYHYIGDELLWVNSLPCLLGEEKSIPIATYGSSNIGRMKHVYRRGLDLRYGRKMQIIAGIHYNISVPTMFWEALGICSRAPGRKEISNAYLAGIRNFHKFCWILFYLFGASPAACRSFFGDLESCGLERLKTHTLYGKYATSLRMSNFGYRNPVQADIRVDHNSIDAYIETLNQTITTPYPKYDKYGVKSNGEYLQLNTNLLQIENEYYSVIRPKRTTFPLEKPTLALKRRGVEYVEIRCIDLDPFDPIGISKHQAQFIEIFMIYCLLHPSPMMTEIHPEVVAANKDATVLSGRKKDLILKRNGENITLKSWALEILDSLCEVAQVFDNALDTTEYSECVALQREKVHHSELTPSAKILDALVDNDEPFFSLAMRQAVHARKTITGKSLTATEIEEFDQDSAESIRKQQQMESEDELDFEQFLEQVFAQKLVD